MTINIKNILFGKYETFEGDPFFWIADFATFYNRNSLQRTITRIIFWIYNVAQFLLILYIQRAYNAGEAFINNFSFLSVLFQVQIMYGNSLREFRIFNKAIKKVGKLVMRGNSKRPDELLRNEAIEISKKMKIFFLTVHLIVIPFSYYVFIGLFSTFNANNQRNILLNLIKFILPNWPAVYITLHIIISIVLGTHSTLIIKTAIFFVLYFTTQIKFALKHLWKDMEKMQQIDRRFVDISYCTNSHEYQKKVKEELIYFLKRYREIKHTVDYVTHIIKWTYFSLIFASGIAVGFNLVWAMKLKGMEIVAAIFVFAVTLYCAVVTSEAGEEIRIQSDNIYNQVQQFSWYKWNKENCDLLLMLLCQTKEPIHIKCYNFVTMNRLSLVSLYRMTYSIITLFMRF